METLSLTCTYQRCVVTDRLLTKGEKIENRLIFSLTMYVESLGCEIAKRNKNSHTSKMN